MRRHTPACSPALTAMHVRSFGVLERRCSMISPWKPSPSPRTICSTAGLRSRPFPLNFSVTTRMPPGRTCTRTRLLVAYNDAERGVVGKRIDVIALTRLSSFQSRSFNQDHQREQGTEDIEHPCRRHVHVAA
jgi:hypothetical protein